MARKAIEIERAGMLTPRERLWAAARKLGTFTMLELQDAARPLVQFPTCETYVKWLVKAGYLSVAVGQRNAKTQRLEPSTYSVARDAFEAPRVTRAGGLVTQGLATLAMWRAMKALGEFDHKDIQRAASLGECAVKPEAAKSYVNALARAGYFRTVRLAKPGTAARYRLARDTGSQPPAITRRRAVFDRNLGEFTWQQPAQEVCDGIE